MTTPFRQPEYLTRESDFGVWVRQNPRLDSYRAGINICDFDGIFHRFKVEVGGRANRSRQYVMQVEVKHRNATLTAAQDDLLTMWNEHRRKLRRSLVWSPMNRCRVWFYDFGIHILILSGQRPDTSDRMTWNGRFIGVDQLENLLRFELHPDTLRRMPAGRRRTDWQQFLPGCE